MHVTLRSPRFDGSDYVPSIDNSRLTLQHQRVFDLMADGEWRTLDEISNKTGDPAASVSAQLRHLRKARFGSHTIVKRTRGDRGAGLYEYQLIVNHGTPESGGTRHRAQDQIAA